MSWNEAIEQAAKIAEIDADWTAFGKPKTFQFKDGPDAVREYRLGLVAGRAIAAQIRRLKKPQLETP